MNPQDLLYFKSHEWVKVKNDIATIGITDYAQAQLGDVTFVELPSIGDIITAEAEIGTIESVKAASELYSPISGEVVEINTSIETNPELVNSSPYADGWLVKIKFSELPTNSLNFTDYEKLIQG